MLWTHELHEKIADLETCLKNKDLEIRALEERLVAMDAELESCSKLVMQTDVKSLVRSIERSPSRANSHDLVSRFVFEKVKIVTRPDLAPDERPGLWLLTTLEDDQAVVRASNALKARALMKEHEADSVWLDFNQVSCERIAVRGAEKVLVLRREGERR